MSFCLEAVDSWISCYEGSSNSAPVSSFTMGAANYSCANYCYHCRYNDALYGCPSETNGFVVTLYTSLSTSDSTVATLLSNPYITDLVTSTTTNCNAPPFSCSSGVHYILFCITKRFWKFVGELVHVNRWIVSHLHIYVAIWFSILPV